MMRKNAVRVILMCLGIVLCLTITIKIAIRSDAVTIEKPYSAPMETVYSPPMTAKVNTEPVENVWPYPISQEEIDLIALVTMAEAEGETELGKRLVIDTILNRMDGSHFPDTVHDVIYYPNAFSSMWNGRVDRCSVKDDIVELIKEELLERTNYECVFFTAGGYSKYGEPMFQECCHYFSSYD